jgi:hypothetical protein
MHTFILNTLHISQLRGAIIKYNSEKQFWFLQTAIAAEAHEAEGQILLEEQAQQRDVSDIPNSNSKNNSFQKRRTEFKTKINLNEEQCIKVLLLRKVCNFNYSET